MSQNECIFKILPIDLKQEGTDDTRAVFLSPGAASVSLQSPSLGRTLWRGPQVAGDYTHRSRVPALAMGVQRDMPPTCHPPQ